MYTQGIGACLQQREEQGGGANGDNGGGEKPEEAFDAVAVAALYGNRAASHVMILGYEQAILDCDRAVELNPKFANAIFRKAMALKKLVRMHAYIYYVAGSVCLFLLSWCTIM